MSLLHLGLQMSYNTSLNTNNNNREANSTEEQHSNNHNSIATTNHNKHRNISMVVPYIQGLGEKLKKTYNKQGIQIHFKGTNTIKQLLMAPQDKDSKLQNSWIIYKYKYPHINCTEEYIGKSGRTFGDRYEEHLKAPSPIYLHTTTTGHSVSPDCFSIVSRESQGLTRNIKEAMYIRVNDPSLNRNLGKFQLPHVWDQVLQVLCNPKFICKNRYFDLSSTYFLYPLASLPKMVKQ